MRIAYNVRTKKYRIVRRVWWWWVWVRQVYSDDWGYFRRPIEFNFYREAEAWLLEHNSVGMHPAREMDERMDRWIDVT